MSADVNNNGLATAEAKDEFPKPNDSSASDFRFASLVALAACPFVLYGSLTDTTWLVLLGILLGPLAILFHGPSAVDASGPRETIIEPSRGERLK